MVLKSRKSFGKKFLAYIDDNAPKLEQRLTTARRDWLVGFWDSADLPKPTSTSTKAAAPDATPEPIYEGEAGAVLTVEEAAALKKIVSALTGDGYAQALYDEMALAVEAGYISGGEIIKEAATIDASFDVVPSETLQAIKDQADAFAFMVNQREQQALYDLIDAAIANGQTIKSLAHSIKDSFAEGYHVTDSAGDVVQRTPTDAWSKMVARTELSRAQTFGAMAVYDNAGIEKVVWMTDHGATVCDDCDALEGEVMDIDSAESPPLHPNCCCSLLPADEDVVSPYVQDMIDAKDEKENAA